nr:hypothetical protein [Tanacetum cinerariifolium]
MLLSGPPPPASGGSFHCSDQDPGISATTAATGHRRHYCRRPPRTIGKLSFSAAEIEAIDIDGHLRSCPGLGVVDRGRRTRSYDRLAGPRKIRVGSWNVGSLTRKLLELCDTLGRHKVDIACFQETKWKGSRAREAGRLNDNVVRVTRRSDKIMTISVVIKGETANVISAYALQVGLSDAEKKRFWDAD